MLKNALCVLSILLCQISFGQLEKLIVEKYYVSDNFDATDTIGGTLTPGSVTYRVYADLLPNTKINKIFGEPNHPFVIQSSTNFFNNKSQGQSFGKDFSKAFLSENTVALDTYITIGQLAKQGSKTFFGLPKDMDNDGSFIGGQNNDGGSQMIANGLLNNQDAAAGIPLTVADGIDTMVIGSSTWTSFGVQDFITQVDSTIFGSLVTGNVFNSEDFYLASSIPIDGVSADTNLVLLAQLTTTGDLHFEMNLELSYLQDGQWVVGQVLARDTLVGINQSFSPFLSYPFECGCTDQNYLEFNSSFVCELEGACQTLAVIGCMDTLACNYNPIANISYDDICCYPGFCGDRDILEVCPQLIEDILDIQVYPNPSTDEMVIQAIVNKMADATIDVYNPFGFKMYTQRLNVFQGMYQKRLSIADWDPGVYYLVLNTPDGTRTTTFIKI